MPAHKTKSWECKKNPVKVSVLLPSDEKRKAIHIKSNHNKSYKCSSWLPLQCSASKARLDSLFRLQHAHICLRQSSQPKAPNLCRLWCQICLNRAALLLSNFPTSSVEGDHKPSSSHHFGNSLLVTHY